MIGETARSFSSTLWNSRKRSRGSFETWQKRRLQNWLRRDLPRVDFYGQAKDLVDLPIIDKATLMNQFTAFNIHGISADQVREAMRSDCRIGDMTVGASTGTSGNRGLFVISMRERFRWLGAILAKTMPDLILRKQRVAIILPQGGALYDSARKARIDLAIFSLLDGPEHWRSELERFDPTIVVAPPKVLRDLTETSIAPVRVFSAAETLDPIDRKCIEGRFSTPLEQIYMATEGLLGVTCRLGNLHLAEESIHFEFEPAGDGLVTPLITSFARQTQIMARYRMNDLLRLGTDCACGSPLQVVDEVVGRMDDVFRLGDVSITPDVLRNTVLDASPLIDDFRLVQSGNQVTLRLLPSLAKSDADRARADVQALLDRRSFPAHVHLEQVALPLETKHKLRRVERLPIA